MANPIQLARKFWIIHPIMHVEAINGTRKNGNLNWMASVCYSWRIPLNKKRQYPAFLENQDRMSLYGSPIKSRYFCMGSVQQSGREVVTLKLRLTLLSVLRWQRNYLYPWTTIEILPKKILIITLTSGSENTPKSSVNVLYSGILHHLWNHRYFDYNMILLILRSVPKIE